MIKEKTYPVCETPVVMIIFNRPHLTQKVFDQIRLVRPKTLMVISDGPRTTHPSDYEKCKATRAVIDQVDWPCNVIKNYSEPNMGNGDRISSGLDWVFEQVEQAIVLEDDCVPEPTFFQFCSEMLEKYKDDPRIHSITGTNPVKSWKPTEQSYHFAKFGGVWGWATWRRSWQNHDHRLKQWGDAEKRQKIESYFDTPAQKNYYCNLFERIYTGKTRISHKWDHQWFATRFEQSTLIIVPSVNLVSNVGFDGDGATMFDAGSLYAKLPTYPLNFPLRHPAKIEADREYDMADWVMVQKTQPSLIMRIKGKLKRLIA